MARHPELNAHSAINRHLERTEAVPDTCLVSLTGTQGYFETRLDMPEPVAAGRNPKKAAINVQS